MHMPTSPILAYANKGDRLGSFLALPSILAFIGNGDLNMTSPRSVIFANPARTAIGTFGGSLKEIAAPNLGAAAIKAAIERAGLTRQNVMPRCMNVPAKNRFPVPL